MLNNIQQGINKEIEELLSRLCGKEFDSKFEWVDDYYVEVDTPFLTNPDARNTEWKTKIGLVFYPELLTYRDPANFPEKDCTVPWICVRLELETPTPELERELLPWLVEVFGEIDYAPFHDEDSFRGYFKKEEKRGWNKYKMYVNPSYPKGYWQNHVL